MIKNALYIFFVFVIAISMAYAQTTSGGKEPKVIDTLSESYQNNTTTQNPSINPPSAGSRKVKYISTFTEPSNQSNSSEMQGNDTSNLQDRGQGVTPEVSNSEQTNSSSQANTTGEDFKERYKVLKSN